MSLTCSWLQEELVAAVCVGASLYSVLPLLVSIPAGWSAIGNGPLLLLLLSLCRRLLACLLT